MELDAYRNEDGAYECPWCGETYHPDDYERDADAERALNTHMHSHDEHDPDTSDDGGDDDDGGGGEENQGRSSASNPTVRA